MKRDTDIYTGRRGAKIRFEMLVPESLHCLITDLSQASGRTFTDLTLEGMSIMADGYKSVIENYRQEQKQRVASTPEEGVTKP
jgi:hypothetical protein